MRLTTMLATVGAVATFLWLAQARAEDVKSSDQAFMEQAQLIGAAEVKLGKLAQEHARRDAVRDFADRMIRDHTRMGNELKELANKKGIKLSDKLDQKHMDLVDTLSKLNADKFDRAYINDMVSGHEKALETFESEAKNGKDADVKAWAEKALPALREHLKLAKDAAKDVKADK